MRGKIENDCIQLYPPVLGQFFNNTVVFVLCIVLYVVITISIGFNPLLLPILLLALLGFLVALWEFVNPIIIDKDGVEGYFSFFSKKRYRWDEVTEVVLCMTTTFGRKALMNRVTAIGFSFEGNKSFTFAYSYESMNFYNSFIEQVNKFAGCDIVDDNRQELVQNHTSGSIATRISVGIFGLIFAYSIVCLVLSLV